MALYDPPARQTKAAAALAFARANPRETAALITLGFRQHYGPEVDVEPFTPEQVLNQCTLADYLRALPADYAEFTMDEYNSGSYFKAVVKGCGTVACAVGHGPLAGVAALPHESWSSYSDRAFGGVAHYVLFGGSWVVVDNTPAGAAARICAVLDGQLQLVRAAFNSHDATLYAAYLD